MKVINLLQHSQQTPDAQEIAALPPDPVWIKFKPPWDEHSIETPADAARDGALCKTSVPIVVADDDPVSRELISALTTKWGFRTIVTRDGHEAMAAIRAEQGAVVAILDWLMPGMDGLQVCQRVRETGKMVYIILLSARGGTANLIEGLECGADEYLVKPFDKSELLARVKVGLRILDLEAHLAHRIRELELAATEIHNLNLRMPL
jgi:sigma-B regulation protein RsbU (phosphoserine phosphatase)